MTEHRDWRERKKARTRRTIQEHALRLFQEQGYEATTVEQIAAAAGVSHMTFFRYFPSKEDVVLSDEYDPMIEALLRARPAAEPVLESMRAVIAEGFGRIYASDKDAIFERTSLVVRTPALRSRLWDQQVTEQRQWARVLEERGMGAFEAQVLAAVLRAALSTTLIAWVDSGGNADLPGLADQAFTLLRDRLTATPEPERA